MTVDLIEIRPMEIYESMDKDAQAIVNSRVETLAGFVTITDRLSIKPLLRLAYMTGLMDRQSILKEGDDK